MRTQHWLDKFPVNHCEWSKSDLSESNSHEEYHFYRREEGWQGLGYYSEKELYKEQLARGETTG